MLWSFTNSDITSSSLNPLVSGILKYTKANASTQNTDIMMKLMMSPYGICPISVKNVKAIIKFAIQFQAAAKLLPRPLKCSG